MRCCFLGKTGMRPILLQRMFQGYQAGNCIERKGLRYLWKHVFGLSAFQILPYLQKISDVGGSSSKQRRQKNGTTRKLGSTDICQSCGAPYTVVSGLQRYCPECAKIVVQDNIRNHKREYMWENRAEKGEQKKERRSMRRICVICGKAFDSKTCTNVCSPECKKIRNREFQKRADIKRGKQKAKE